MVTTEVPLKMSPPAARTLLVVTLGSAVACGDTAEPLRATPVFAGLPAVECPVAEGPPAPAVPWALGAHVQGALGHAGAIDHPVCIRDGGRGLLIASYREGFTTFTLNVFQDRGPSLFPVGSMTEPAAAVEMSAHAFTTTQLTPTGVVPHVVWSGEATADEVVATDIDDEGHVTIDVGFRAQAADIADRLTLTFELVNDAPEG